MPGGLLDYLLPTVRGDPAHRPRGDQHPEPAHAPGREGRGESGCIGTPPAIVNAVADALELADPDVLQMPLTPDVVWRAAR